MENPDCWDDAILGARAERRLGRMDAGRIAPPAL
jgi:hypothetical protein